jgi:ATP diphosphatase
MKSSTERLKDIMAQLRDPENGCPWDIEQDFRSILPHTIEEAYEVADAIEQDDMAGLKEELGDLLLQVVYHSQMAAEQRLFTFDEVAGAVADKMVARHPHVFGAEKAASAEDVNIIWEEQKHAEKQGVASLSSVTKGLPALLRAQKLQKKAAKTGFEWRTAEDAFEKLEEEINEFKEATEPTDKEEELGDLLFCLVNYARMRGLNSEEALRKANDKFTRRFTAMEELAAKEGKAFSALPVEDMIAYWKEIK